jgi:two-component sensor histidine kinase
LIPALTFEEHLAKANELNRINLFSESIKEIDLAIKIALTKHDDFGVIEAKITMGELMRRTQNYQKGLEMLCSLKNSIKYPKLHARKLGRIAAIYAENGRFFEAKYGSEIRVQDSISFYVNEALKIAMKYHFNNEEASLRNELGLFLLRHNKKESAIYELKTAAKLFWQLGDTLNYIVTGVNILNYYFTISDDKEFDAFSSKLLKLSQNRKWYTAEARVFKMISSKYFRDGDSLQHYKWMLRVGDNTIAYYNAISSAQIKSFEVLYETEKFRNEASASELKSLEQSKIIEEEAIKSIYLSVGLLFAFLLLVTIVLVMLNERKGKLKISKINSALNLSNVKYSLLMIESNHRIKNNLQMIISMLEYARQDVSSEDSKTMDRISNRIYTISALHNHLYSDLRKPKVDIKEYFEEIVIFYHTISPASFEMKRQIDSIEINSERIVYFGLILNEILANTFKHESAH